MYKSENTNYVHQRGLITRDIHKGTELDVSGTPESSNLSEEIIVRGAEKISIQFECEGNSKSVDLFVYTSFKKGGKFTTKHRGCLNLGSGDIDQISISPGIYAMKIEIVNCDKENKAIVTTGAIANWN